jgi:hypothetical protein
MGIDDESSSPRFVFRSCRRRHTNHRVSFPRAGCGKSACPVRRAGCVKKTRNRRAVRKMKEGPSEPPCRRRLQTAISCFGPKTAVVNVMVKRRGERSRHVWIRETSVSHPLAKASKSNSDEHQNRSYPLALGKAWRLPTYRPCGVPVHRRRDSNSGFRTELENRASDAKGKAQVEDPRGRKYRCTGQGRTAS